jgi:hypothetical protein
MGFLFRVLKAMLQCSNIAVAELFLQRIFTNLGFTCRFFVIPQQAWGAFLSQGLPLKATVRP